MITVGLERPLFTLAFIQINQISGVYRIWESKNRTQIEFEREPKRLVFFWCVIGFAGDSDVQTNQGLCLVYVHAGTNPFEVINQAVK